MEFSAWASGPHTVTVIMANLGNGIRNELAVDGIERIRTIHADRSRVRLELTISEGWQPREIVSELQGLAAVNHHHQSGVSVDLSNNRDIRRAEKVEKKHWW